MADASGEEKEGGFFGVATVSAFASEQYRERKKEVLFATYSPFPPLSFRGLSIFAAFETTVEKENFCCRFGA